MLLLNLPMQLLANHFRLQIEHCPENTFLTVAYSRKEYINIANFNSLDNSDIALVQLAELFNMRMTQMGDLNRAWQINIFVCTEFPAPQRELTPMICAHKIIIMYTNFVFQNLLYLI